MKAELKTQVDSKFFKEKATVTAILSGNIEDRYVYKVEVNKKFFIVKGYNVKLPQIKNGDPDSKTSLFGFLNKLERVYQEYFFAKMACVYSRHFAKPLAIDHEVQWAPNDFGTSNLYTEIIFEYGGESIDNLGDTKITTIYNLMRQSASALCLLHNTGVIHMDIKPQNMVFANGLLKIIDMGGSHGYETKSIVYKPTVNLKGKITEFTRAFSPPEILKEYEKINPQSTHFELGKVDVYSWAMSFFSILLSRSAHDLESDIVKYKLKTPEVYAKFFEELVTPELSIIETNNETEEKIKLKVQELLKVQLSYDPSERYTMPKIVQDMKNFELKEKIDINYKAIEIEQEKDILRLFMINQNLNLKEEDINRYTEERKSPRIQLEEKKSPITRLECEDCKTKKNVKIELGCGHCICRRCTYEYIMMKFTKGQSYNYSVLCSICKKQLNLCIIFINS